MLERTCSECKEKYLDSKYSKSCKKNISRPTNCLFCSKEFLYSGICGKKTQKVPKYCSKECVQQGGELKRKETLLAKYGVDNFSKTKEFREKMKQESFFKTDEFRKRMEEKYLSEYGVKSYVETKEFKEKNLKTLEEKYGVKNVAQLEEVKNKMRETNLRKYGTSHPLQNNEIKRKTISSKLKNQGVLGSNPNIKHKEDFNNLENFLKNSKEFTLKELADYFEVDFRTIKRKALQGNYQHLIKNFNSYSLPEEEIILMLDKIGVNYILHDRKSIYPKELDFFLPEFKIGIEVNPTWTHQFSLERGVDKEYHYNKFKACSEKGIELISIFDWTDLNLIQSFLRDKCSLNTQKIFARNCIIRSHEGVLKQDKIFLKENHLLGSINNKSGAITSELIFNDEVVGLAVFYPTNINNRMELKRLGFKGNIKIIGGASKLIKSIFNLKTEVKELVTFSDNDLGTGNVYKKLGFVVLEENKGTLIWSHQRKEKYIKNLSLVKQGADRLLNNFPGYIPIGQGENLPSNQEIIQSYGFLPVYDCGYTKWIYKKEE